MAERKLTELAQRAAKNELTSAELNQIVLAIVDNERAQDADIKNLKIANRKTDRKFQDIDEEWPLLNPEADDLSKAVRKKGVEVLGGKDSAAYQNTDLRRRVYRDIYGEIKRQYGLEDEQGRQLSYKKLKRKYLKGALLIAEGYVAPIALANEIETENDLEDMM